MWDTLIQLFRELSETSKLIIFIWFIVIIIAYTVWWILSWRNERQLTKDLEGTRKQLQEVTQERDQLQERLLALDRVDSHVWTKPDQYGTACINALTCADHVVIPSTLSQLDIEAVPRTLKWLHELHAVVRASFLCVVVTRARMRGDSLVSYEREQMDRLARFIKVHQPGEGFVLPYMVPESPKIHQLTAEGKAAALHSPEGRAWFGAIADEIERRVRQ